jgi:hypothetical protein
MRKTDYRRRYFDKILVRLSMIVSMKAMKGFKKYTAGSAGIYTCGDFKGVNKSGSHPTKVVVHLNISLILSIIVIFFTSLISLRQNVV